MKFLDTSFLIDYLKSKKYTLEYLEANREEAFYSSTLSLFEILRGELKTGGSAEELKKDIKWLNEKELDFSAAEEAAKIEKELSDRGKKINLADVLIAGTARKTGAEIVTGDSDFHKIEDLETIQPKEK